MIYISEHITNPVYARKKTGHASRTLTMYMGIAFIGIIFSMFAMFIPGSKDEVLLVSFMGTMFSFMAAISVIMLCYANKVSAVFDKLKQDERVAIYLTRGGDVVISVFKLVHDALLFRSGYGFMENNGWQLRWGKKHAVLALQGYGDTLAPEQAGYHSQLKKEGIKDYEEAIKRYLGPIKYVDFKRRFRVNPIPDIFEIRKELEYLRTSKPADPLSFSINGETLDFKDMLNYQYYASTPIALENAVERERINEHELAFSYKPQDKSIKWALAILLILIGAGVLIVMIGNTDLGAMFGGIAGGAGIPKTP